MNRSVTDILDYIITEKEYLNEVEMTNYIFNRYDIDITNDVIEYIKINK